MASTPTVQGLLDKLQFDFAAFEAEKSKAKAVTISDPKKDIILGGETLPSWYTGETKQLLDILLPKDKAQSWITGEKESWMVHVHGNKEPKDAELSHLSAAVATLIDAPQLNTEHIYPLVFFCGLHRMRHDPKRQIINMMMSLSVQLLKMVLDRKVDINLAEIRNHIDIREEYIEHNRFSDAFCSEIFFAELVNRLPEGSVVHCAVDNILHFWNDRKPDDYAFANAFSLILYVVRTFRKTHIKLVLTCTTNVGLIDKKSRLLRDSEEHIVDVDRPL